MKKMAIISAGFVPVPAVDGGAGEVLTTEIINGNEIEGDYYMDIYTIESPKLNAFRYRNAEIVQVHITKWNWFICKARNMFLKLFKIKYRFIPYNRALLKKFRDNYDLILIENNMQVYEDIYSHAKTGKESMIYHMHNDIDGTTKPEYLCKFIAQTAKAIIPVSDYIKEHFNKVAPNHKMKTLYNCVNLELFDVNNNYKTNELKKELKIQKEDFVFMYSGRICPEKGILELIKAFKNLSKKYSHAKLLIVGSKWYNQIDRDDYYSELVSELKGFEDKIVFTGYIFPRDMPYIYSVGDSLVIPSMWEEPFGVVALEGMAMKLPIVCTDSGGLKEVLDEKVALIVKRDKNIVSNLQISMERIIKDKEVRDKMANLAYEKLLKRKEFNSKYYYRCFKQIIDS